MLAPAFLILGQPYIEKKIKQGIDGLRKEEEDLIKSNLMASGPDKVYKQMEVKDLGSFTAYTN